MEWACHCTRPVPDVLVITLMGKENLKSVRSNCFFYLRQDAGRQFYEEFLVGTSEYFQNEMGCVWWGSKRGILRLSCPYCVTCLCLYDGKLDDGKDCGLMYEGRCWKFNVSTVSGFLSVDLVNFTLHRLLLELHRIRLDGEWWLLVGFVARVTVIVSWK